MNVLPSILQPAVRKGPRYSVHAFYTTILVFAAIAAVSLVLGNDAHPGGTAQKVAGGSLTKRDVVPEVTPRLEHAKSHICEVRRLLINILPLAL